MTPKWRAWRDRNRQKMAAHRTVYQALRAGRITRQPCEVCGDPTVVAHHALGYDLPNRLRVAWLCGDHHREVHPIAQAGIKNGRAKLTEDDVRAIRASGESWAALGRRYSINETTARRIALGQRWPNVS